MSSIQERLSCANHPDDMDESLFAHIHLDSSILGSILEGNVFSKTTAYILKTLELFSKKEFNLLSLDKEKLKQVFNIVKGKFEDLSETDQLLNEFSDYSKRFFECSLEEIEEDIVKTATTLADKLEKKKSLMIAGGWRGLPGNPGHAMAYEFIKNEIGTYTFIVFNTGAGIDYHQGLGKFKEKYSPIKAFVIPKGVSAEEITHFIAKLIEPRIKPKINKISDRDIDWTAAKSFNANRLYEENIASIHLMGAKEIDSRTLSPMMTQGQLSGTCSMRVLMPILRIGMQGEDKAGESFRHYLYQLRIQSIIDFYRIQDKLKKLSEPKTQILLEKAIAKLIRTTRRFMKCPKQHAPILTEQDGKSYLEMLNELCNKLANEKSKKQEIYIDFKLSKPIQTTTAFSSINSGSMLDSKKELEKLTKIEQEKELPLCGTSKNFAEYIRTCHTIFNQLDIQGNSQRILKDIRNFCMQFPFDIQILRKYTDLISPEEAKILINLLRDTLRIYGKHCNYLSPYPKLAQIITSQTLSLLAVIIAEQYFKGKISEPDLSSNRELLEKPLSNLAFMLPRSLDLNELVTVTRDPLYDERYNKLKNLYQNLGTESHSSLLSEMDEQFLNQYLAKETQEELLSPTLATKNNGADDYDTKRLKLYELLSGKVKLPATASINLISALVDYDILLQIEQLLMQSRCFSKASYDLFLEDQSSFANSSAATRRQCTSFYHEGREMELPNGKKSYYLYFHNIEKRQNINFNIIDYLLDFHDILVKPTFADYNNEYYKPKFSNSIFLSSIGTACPPDLQFTRIEPQGRPIATLDYFSSHFEHLNKREYQIFFLVNFFSIGAIQIQLSRNPGFVDNILTFIKKAFLFHIQEDEITPGAVFIVYFSSLLLNYLKEHPDSSKFEEHVKEISAIIMNSSDTALKTLRIHYNLRSGTKENISKNINDLLMAKFILFAKQSPNNLNPRDLKLLFQAILKFKSQGSLGHQSVYFYDDFKDQLAEMMPLIKKIFSSLDIKIRQILAQEIVKECLESELLTTGETYTLELKDFQVYLFRKNKPNLCIDLGSGEITATLGKNQLLPKDFYKSEFGKLFGNDPIQAFLEELEGYTIARFEYPISIIDSPKRNYQVIFNKKSKAISIYAELGNPLQWFEFIETPPNSIPKIMGSLHYSDYNRAWWKQTNNDPFTSCREWYCTDYAGNYKLHIMAGDSKDQDIADNLVYHCDELDNLGNLTGYFLCNLDYANDNLSQYLSRIEDPENIEVYQYKCEKVWQEAINTDLILYKIRFPKYGLEFLGKKTKEGSIEFTWSQDPNYSLLPETSPLLGHFNHCLYLTNAKGEKIAIVPQKEFYATKKLQESQGLYPALRYDIQNEIPKNDLFKQGLNSLSWHHENSSKYYQFRIGQNGLIEANSSEDYLGLAYLSLACQDPLRAMECLRACGKIKGTFEEIEILMKIMVEIPNSEFKDFEPFPKRVRDMDPNTSAVRLYAASMLAEQQQISFRNPLFSLQKAYSSKPTHANEAYADFKHKKVVNFYLNDFGLALRDIHREYFMRLGNVSKELQVPAISELTVLRSHYGSKEAITSVVLQNRWQVLENNLLIKEKNDLLKKLAQEKILNSVDSLRLKEIMSIVKIKQYLPYGLKEYVLTQEIIDFPSPSFYIDLYSFQQRGYRKKQLAIMDLNATLSPREFLYNFEIFYEIARSKPPKNKELKNEAELLDDKNRLKNYIYSVLQSHIQQKHQSYAYKKSFLFLEACRFLAYVLEYPKENWHSFPYSYNRDFNNNLEMIRKLLSKNNKVVLLPVTKLETKIVMPINDKKESKDKVNKSSSEASAKPMRLNLDSAFDLAQELNLEPMVEALSKLSRPPSPEHELFEVEKKLNADPFIQSQERKFKSDLKAGQEKNLLLERKIKIFNQHLSDSTKRNTIKLALEKRFTKESMELKNREESLLQLANLALTGEKATLDTRLGIKGKQIVPLKFNDLIGLYLQGDRLEIINRSRLDDLYCDQLYQAIHQYLILETNNQQRKRAIDYAIQLESLKKDSIEFEQGILKLGEEICSKKSYRPCDNPLMLVFEYYENLMILPRQAALINRLTSKEVEGFTNEVIQLIMGGGKSKVLLPLLALKKAEGNNLSVIEVPASLFETNLVDLQITTERLFGKKGYPFVFDRNTDASVTNLNHLFKVLDQHVRIERNYVITTAESIQSLELKYLEILAATPINEAQIIAFEKILSLIRKSDALIDECDTVLDPKNELNYTIGKRIPVPRYILTTIQKLYRLFDQIPVPTLNGISNLKQVMLGKITVTNDLQWQDIFKQLAISIVKLPESPINHCIQSLKKHDEELLIQYLCNEAKEIPSFIRHLSEQDQKIIDLTKGEITLFKSALRKKPNENYGFPKSVNYQGSKELGIPYLANNTPNERAEFGSVFEIINYTLQLQKQKDLLSFDLIYKFINEFKSRAKQEVADRNYLIKSEMTEAAKEFNTLTGHELSGIHMDDINQIKALQEKFSKNEDINDYILLNYVLSEIYQYPKILRSNGINHVSQYRSVQAITGTPWNTGCYHPALKFDENLSLGTDGQIIHQLLKKNPRIEQLIHLDANSIIKQSFDGSKGNELKAIIDAGALFNGIDNRQVAEKIALQLKEKISNQIKYVLFFNEKNELAALCLEGKALGEPILIGSTNPSEIAKKTKNSNPSERFTYYDQRHTTGIDLKQDQAALGELYIDANTKIRDVCQSALRLRQFAGNQKLSIALPSSLATAIEPKTSIGITDIISFTHRNQQKILSEAHLLAAFDKMENTIRKNLLDKIYYANSMAEKSKLIKIFDQVFTYDASIDPSQQFGYVARYEKTADILEKKLKSSLHLYDQLTQQAEIYSEQDHNEIEKKLYFIKNQAEQQCLLGYQHLPTRSEGHSVLVQREKDLHKDINKDREIDKQIQSKSAIEAIFINADWQKLPNKMSKEDRRMLSLNDLLQKSANLAWRFSENIYISTKFAHTIKNQTDFLGQYLKPINFLLLMTDPNGKLNLLIIAAEEVEFFVDRIDQDKDRLKNQGYSYWIASTSGTIMNGTSLKIEHEDYFALLEQIRFLNVDLKLIAEEGRYEWLLSGFDQKIAFLEQQLLPKYADRRKFINKIKESQKQEISKRLSTAIFDIEAVYNAIKKHDTKLLKEQIEKLHQIKSKYIEEAYINTKSKFETLPLFAFAIIHKNPEIFKLLLEEPLLFKDDHSEHSTFKTALQNYEPSIYEAILAEPRFFPSLNDRMAWSQIITTVLESADSRKINPFMANLARIVSNDNPDQIEFLRNITIDVMRKLIKAMRNKSLELGKMLAQLIDSRLFLGYEQFWGSVIHIILEEYSDQEFLCLLSTWQKESTQEFRTFHYYLSDKLFFNIASKDPTLLEKVLANPEFWPKTSEEWYHLLLCTRVNSATIPVIISVISKIKESDKNELSKLESFERFIRGCFETPIFASDKEEFFEKRHLFLPLLSFYPVIDNTQQWNDLMKLVITDNKDIVEDIFQALLKRPKAEQEQAKKFITKGIKDNNQSVKTVVFSIAAQTVHGISATTSNPESSSNVPLLISSQK